EGTYGMCAVCGADIPHERLVAHPTTSHCIEHANEEGFESARPVEEQVLNPNLNPDEETAMMKIKPFMIVKMLGKMSVGMARVKHRLIFTVIGSIPMKCIRIVMKAEVIRKMWKIFYLPIGKENSLVYRHIIKFMKMNRKMIEEWSQ